MCEVTRTNQQPTEISVQLLWRKSLKKQRKAPPYAGAPGAPVIPKKNALIILSVAVTLALVFWKRFTCEHDHCHWQVPGTCQT